MSNLKIFVKSMKVMGKRMPLYLAAILFMSVSFATFSVMNSLLMKSVVDIAQTGDYQSMKAVIAGIVIAGILSLIVYRKAAIIYNVEAKRVFGILSEKVLDHAMKLPYSYYEKHHSGEIISKITYDLNGMGNIYGSRFRRVLMPLLEVIVFLIPMLLLNWRLTLCLIGVNLIILMIDMITAEPMHRVRTGLAEITKRMTSRLSDLLQGMEQVRMYPAGRDIVNSFKTENRNYAKDSRRYIFLSACLESADRGFDLLCSLFFLVVGVYFVGKGYADLSSLAAIYTMYAGFSHQFLMLGKYIPELAACLANAQNIFAFLEEEGEPENWYQESGASGINGLDAGMTGAGTGIRKQGMIGTGISSTGMPEAAIPENAAVSIRNLSFAYNAGEEVLKDFSLDAARGESIAITGPSGCGKTTLSKLLLGLYPAVAGDIRVDGKSIKECTLRELRERIAYVPQEPYLFQGSVKENIGCAREDASEQEIVEAAKLANAHDFIMEFPEKYDTQVSERGRNMSGGQRQRIAIARAILKNTPVILLDEATSALDNESEYLVNEAMKNLKGQRTIIMIAHRPSTIQLADRVCEMAEMPVAGLLG